MTVAARCRISAPRPWLLDLDALGGTLLAPALAKAIASDLELSWPDRTRLATRIALRLLLRAAGARLPFKAELPLTSTGKPQLAPGEPSFSVSHSGHHALILVAPSGPVGVDLETQRVVDLGPARRALLLAACAVVTQASGRAAGSRAPGVDGGEASLLLAGWTCLEAVAKARGCGIGRVLTEIGITAAGARLHRPEAVAELTRDLLVRSGLEVVTLELPAGLHGGAAAPAGLLPSSLAVEQLDAGHVNRLLVGRRGTRRPAGR